MKNITLDGKTYPLDQINPRAQVLARQTGAASDLIRRLEDRIAIARTAQAQYVEDLKASLKDAGEL